jgi:hypothetical protein
VGGKWKDYAINLSITSLDDDAIGVIFRYVDDENYYRFTWNRSGQYQRIEKRQNGVLSVLAEKTGAYETGLAYNIQVAMQGSQIKVSVDGTTVFAIVDTSFDQGSVGLYSSLNQGSIFDDITVTDLVTGYNLLSDNFNDGDYTGWTIFDDPGTNNGPSTWAVSNGRLTQSSNVGTSDYKLGTLALYTRGSWTDYATTVSMTSKDNDSMGLMFRYHDNNNYYRFSWDNQEGFRRLEKRFNGVFTTLAEDAVPYVSGRAYEIKVMALDTRVQVVVDGQTIFSVTDSSLPAGTIALYSRWNKGTVFDNILVEDVRNGNLVLSEDFSDGNLLGWTIVDDAGTEAGPSAWSVQHGALLQSSNIGSNSSGKLGTFVLY